MHAANTHATAFYAHAHMLTESEPVEVQRMGSIEPTAVRTPSRKAPQRRSTVADLKNKFAPVPMVTTSDDRRSSATALVQHPTPSNAAPPAQAGQSEESEPKGIGRALRRIISRTRSRAHLKQANNVSDGGRGERDGGIVTCGHGMATWALGK